MAIDTADKTRFQPGAAPPDRRGDDDIQLAMVRRDPPHVVMSRDDLLRLAREMQRSDKREETAQRAVRDAMLLAWGPTTFMAAALRHRTVDLDAVAHRHCGRWLDVRVRAMFGPDGAMFQTFHIEEAR